MKITKLSNKIIVDNPTDFNVIQTLCCGQIFRYVIDGNTAKVFSKDKMATLSFTPQHIEIVSTDIDYFFNFFDFGTDYKQIKDQLSTDKLVAPAIKFAPGIRILNNDAYEMMISFIISANNNIGRIKKSIEYLCSHFGSNMGDYYAFPTLEQLKTATVEDFKQAGLGYRAEQMFDTVQKLTNEDIDFLKQAETREKQKKLMSFKGIGEKVANCIMLFGLQVKTVFPVDVWINKVYNHIFNKNETDRSKITRELTERYGNLSGYAQQYFYYYYRENKIG